MPIKITLKPKPIHADKKDIYTEDILMRSFDVFLNYYNGRLSLKEKGLKIRLPGFPEDISENMIKFILRNNGDSTVHWNTTSGDLYSSKEGRIECKATTSAGPISFSPTSDWDVLYVMDATQWRCDKYIVYRINIKKSYSEWSEIKVKRTENFGDQCKSGRRPRCTWSMLKPQLGDHCQQVFCGTFNEMLVKAPTC